MEKEKSTGSFASFASTGGNKPILAALLHSRLGFDRKFVALASAKSKHIQKGSAGNLLPAILKERNANSMRLSRLLASAKQFEALFSRLRGVES
jgi:hypothetical protein